MINYLMSNLMIVVPLFFVALWLHERGHLRALNAYGHRGVITYGWHEWGVEYKNLTLKQEENVLKAGIGIGLFPLGFVMLISFFGLVDSWLVLGMFVLYFVGCADDIKRLAQIEKIGGRKNDG